MLFNLKQITVLIFSLLLWLFSSVGLASYVYYNNSVNIGSVPVTQSGFYYSDNQGNYVSIRQSKNVPVIFTHDNYGRWISGGVITPQNAIAVQYVNGYPVFACRVIYNQKMYYGQMVPNQGCYILNISPAPFSTFEILVR